MTELDPGVVEASNNLTRRWAARLLAGPPSPGQEGFDDGRVFSALGAWIVLAAALAGSDGDARIELQTALGIDHGQAAEAAAGLNQLLADTAGLAAAMGLWAKPDVELREEFVRALEPIEVGPVPTGAQLDAWVAEHTDGLIESFPVEVDAATTVLLAGIVCAQGSWVEPFEPGGTMAFGTGEASALTRTGDAAEASIIGSQPGRQVSRVICETTAGFEVHLLGGDEPLAAVDVLEAGFDALADTADVAPGTSLRAGQRAGMLGCELWRDAEPDMLSVRTPHFELSNTHDLAADAELFGLTSALRRGNHFPLLASTPPLFIQEATQACVATFSQQGFRAAAVTALQLWLTGALPDGPDVPVLVATYDRPFGFLVVEPDSGLVLFAGWLDQPRARDIGDESPWN